MKVTYYGHACFMVETNGKKVLFDPFITPNEMASHIDVSQINPDFILVTHGHGDHVADVEAIGKRAGSMVISNFEVASWFGEKGMKNHPLNHGGKSHFDFGTAKYVNAIHTSSLPDGSNGGNPGGFVVWNNEGAFYHAGDTALTMDMKLIPRTCPALDFAILPIGDNFTMGYEDAAIAAEFIECDTIIGCHFDTFGYIKIDHEAARNAFEAKGKQLILLEIGQEWSM
ncbi:MAG: metal-dependent hydrolase [Saprospiraceae bacterium]|nr:metal-dependent hydrolase [Saprospiraceae bacterium]